MGDTTSLRLASMCTMIFGEVVRYSGVSSLFRSGRSFSRIRCASTRLTHSFRMKSVQ